MFKQIKIECSTAGEQQQNQPQTHRLRSPELPQADPEHRPEALPKDHRLLLPSSLFRSHVDKLRHLFFRICTQRNVGVSNEIEVRSQLD